MENHQLVINIKNTVNTSEFFYYYEIKTKYRRGGGRGKTLEEFFTRLEDSLEGFQPKENELKIILKTETLNGSEKYMKVVNADDFKSIETMLSNKYKIETKHN